MSNETSKQLDAAFAHFLPDGYVCSWCFANPHLENCPAAERDRLRAVNADLLKALEELAHSPSLGARLRAELAIAGAKRK